jgi:hypothetical protein
MWALKVTRSAIAATSRGSGNTLAPFAERQVGRDRDRDRGPFFAFGDDLKQQLRAAGVDLDVAQLVQTPGSQTNRQSAAGEAGRNWVEALPHRHPGAVVHPRLQLPGRVERLDRQRHQSRRLGGERGGDRDRSAGDHSPVVVHVAGRDPLVQRR